MSEINVSCCRCKEAIKLTILTEADLGIGSFDIGDQQHLRLLQKTYNVAYEVAVLSAEKKIYHHNCFPQAGSTKVVPLFIFIQLYYLTLQREQRCELLKFMTGKESLQGINKQTTLGKFSTIYSLMVTHYLRELFSLQPGSPAVAEIEQARAMPKRSHEDSSSNPDLLEDSKLAEQLSSSIRCFYNTPLDLTPTDSSLSRSISQSRVEISEMPSISLMTASTSSSPSPRYLSPLRFPSPIAASTPSHFSGAATPAREGVTLLHVRNSFLQQRTVSAGTQTENELFALIKDALAQIGHLSVNSLLAEKVTHEVVKRYFLKQDWESYLQQQLRILKQPVMSASVVPHRMTAAVIPLEWQAIIVYLNGIILQLSAVKSQQELTDQIVDLNRQLTEKRDQLDENEVEVTDKNSEIQRLRAEQCRLAERAAGLVSDRAVREMMDYGSIQRGDDVALLPRPRKPASYCNKRNLILLIIFSLLVFIIAALAALYVTKTRL